MRKLLSVLAATLLTGCASIADAGALADVAVINRTTGCKGMRLWRDRYHARPLRTPREVRNCLVYVLRNGLKHGSTAFAVDPCSSAPWFDGFAGRSPVRTDPGPTVPASTWLLATGWRARGGGAIRSDETPGRSQGAGAIGSEKSSISR